MRSARVTLRRGALLARVARVALIASAGLLAFVTVGVTPSAAQSPPPNLESARAAWEKAPTNVDSVVWYGRRVAYTGAFDEAIAIYTEGLRHHPNDPQLLRHRGHRYLSARNFPAAIADLQRAYELIQGQADVVEADGQPNARGIPLSTLHSNIRYHLALGHFLTGNFPRAAEIWAEDARLASNRDHTAAATFWWVLSLARQGSADEAQAALATIEPGWEMIENGSYYRALLWMKGLQSEAELRATMTTPLERQTIGNGIAQWQLANGSRASAEAEIRAILATGPSASFGYLAAEATAAALGLP